ncbi:hypothetical protein ACOME3_001448 [Neoechinorhynchus agilis]
MSIGQQDWTYYTVTKSVSKQHVRQKCSYLFEQKIPMTFVRRVIPMPSLIGYRFRLESYRQKIKHDEMARIFPKTFPSTMFLARLAKWTEGSLYDEHRGKPDHIRQLQGPGEILQLHWKERTVVRDFANHHNNVSPAKASDPVDLSIAEALIIGRGVALNRKDEFSDGLSLFGPFQSEAVSQGI